MNVYETMINQLATEVAIKAEQLLMDRISSLGSRMLMKAFVETPEFSNFVETVFVRQLETPVFSDAVEEVAQRVAQDEAADAVRDHERTEAHISIDDVLSSNEFDRAAQDAAEEAITDADIEDNIKELNGRVTELDDRSAMLINNNLLTEKIASLFTVENDLGRQALLRAIATGSFNLEQFRAALGEWEPEPQIIKPEIAAEVEQQGSGIHETAAPEEKEGF